jgi:hypothetical protein
MRGGNNGTREQRNKGITEPGKDWNDTTPAYFEYKAKDFLKKINPVLSLKAPSIVSPGPERRV